METEKSEPIIENEKHLAENAHEKGENRIIVYREKDLPPLQEGYIRVLHVTSPYAAERILHEGLKYDTHGTIESTTRGFCDESNIEYIVEDPRFNWPGSKIVVMDMPRQEYGKHVPVGTAPMWVSPEYVVGIIEANAGVAAQQEIEQTYREPENIPYDADMVRLKLQELNNKEGQNKADQIPSRFKPADKVQITASAPPSNDEPIW